MLISGYRKILRFLFVIVLFWSSAVLLVAQNKQEGVKCVVLDPGHGGHDHGCMSKDKKYREEHIV